MNPPSAILYASKRVNAEALPVWYHEARLEITLASTAAGTCCVPWLKPCFGICPPGAATIAPWPVAFQMYSDCGDGYLTQKSLRRFRHVDLLLHYSAAERAAFADIEVWKAHLKLLSSFAQILGTSGGALQDLGLDLIVIADNAWEAADLFLTRENGRLRSLLSPFQTYITRLKKARIEPVLSAQYRRRDLGRMYDSSARFVMNGISKCCDSVRRQIQDPATFTKSELEDVDADAHFKAEALYPRWRPTPSREELVDMLHTTPSAHGGEGGAVCR